MGYEQQERQWIIFNIENDLNGLWMGGTVAAGGDGGGGSDGRCGAFGSYIAALLSHVMPVDVTKNRMSFAVE